VVAFVLSNLVALAWLGATGHDTGVGVLLAFDAGQWAGLVGAVHLATTRKGSGSVVEDFGLRIRLSDAPLGLAVGAVSQFALVPLLYLPLRLLAPDRARELSKPAKQLFDGVHGAQLALLVLLVVIGAPIVEELFFRGLLLRALRRRYGPVPAIALSAALFGLAHFEPLQTIALAAFGAVLGWLAERSGRLGPGIFAHCAFNLATVVVLTH
jgi:membrane protease YdiL (CAAX protease family)